MKLQIKKNSPVGLIQKIAIGAVLAAGTFFTATLSTSAAVIIGEGFANIGGNGYVSGFDESVGSKWNPSAINRPTITAGTDNTGLSNNYWVFSGANYVDHEKLISWNSGKYVQGAIGIGTITSGILEVTTVYELQSTRNKGDPKWAAVGFLSSTNVNWTSSAGGNLLSASISADGHWWLYEKGADSTGIPLASDSDNGATQLTAFAVDSVTTLTLKFNIEAGTAALFVDNTNISGWIATSTDATSIAAAGYHVAPESTTSPDPRAFWVDDFTVSVTAVPEPAVAAVIIGALVALAFLAHRKVSASRS